jgi:hypothetical protein
VHRAKPRHTKNKGKESKTKNKGNAGKRTAATSVTIHQAGFEILIAVVMNGDIMPCSSYVICRNVSPPSSGSADLATCYTLVSFSADFRS